MIIWQWPLVLLITLVLAIAICLAIVWHSSRKHKSDNIVRTYDIDNDLQSEHAQHLFRIWKRDNRFAIAALIFALIITVVLNARPSQVSADDERSNNRDIVLCLDVSGSTLPYDHQIIDTYRSLVSHFKGERIGLSIFNSTSRTVFPLTDDYDLVNNQLAQASKILEGVETQDDIDQMSDKQYQDISDWLEGTQNKSNATSLIGDGLVSCAAMLPGFTYGKADAGAQQRTGSIVLATDNVVSGQETYSLKQALDMTNSANITVDGIYSGPSASEHDASTAQMKQQIEHHHGLFLTASNQHSVQDLVRSIDAKQINTVEQHHSAAYIDAPGWFTLALALMVLIWLALAWRLRR